MAKATALADPSNDATILMPFSILVRLRGTSDMLFHRWSNEDVAAKASAVKGGASKKTDNVESYVYRTVDGEIGLPGEYIRQSIIGAAKYRQDPRSPRKSAMEIVKAGIVCLTPLASLGKDEWDYLDMRRVTIQRNGITRVRPAMLAGWEAEFVFMNLLPEYISEDFLQDLFVQAGRLIGTADFRPSYGRFAVTHFERLTDHEEAI